MLYSNSKLNRIELENGYRTTIPQVVKLSYSKLKSERLYRIGYIGNTFQQKDHVVNRFLCGIVNNHSNFIKIYIYNVELIMESREHCKYDGICSTFNHPNIIYKDLSDLSDQRRHQCPSVRFLGFGRSALRPAGTGLLRSHRRLGPSSGKEGADPRGPGLVQGQSSHLVQLVGDEMRS